MASEYNGYPVVAATIFSIIISTLAVVFRFWARKVKGIDFAMDDYMIVAALFIKYGIDISGFVLIKHGLGQHMAEVHPDDIRNFLRTIYTGPFLYIPTIVLVKLSILLLYRRIFPVGYIKAMTTLIGSILILWGLVMLGVGIFNCVPVHKAWDSMTPGYCIDLVQYYYILQVPNIVTDVAILVLPVKVIWELKLNKKLKLGLLLTFSCGILTTIFDIIRLVSLIELDPTDLTYNAVKPAVWTDIEPGVAILAACLPLMKPLLLKFTGSVDSQVSASTGNSSGGSYRMWSNIPERKSSSTRAQINPAEEV